MQSQRVTLEVSNSGASGWWVTDLPPLSLKVIQEHTRQAFELQQRVVRQLQEKQTELQDREKGMTQNRQKIKEVLGVGLADLSRNFKTFGLEFKTEWSHIFHEFFEITKQIVQVYQLRVKKLEQQLTENGLAISRYATLQQENILLKQMLFTNQRLDTQGSGKKSEILGRGKIKINDILNIHGASYMPSLHSSLRVETQPYLQQPLGLSSKITELFEEQAIESSLSQISNIALEDSHPKLFVSRLQDYDYVSQRGPFQSCDHQEKIPQRPDFKLSFGHLLQDSKDKGKTILVKNQKMGHSGKENKKKPKPPRKESVQLGNTKFEDLRRSLFQKKKSMDRLF